MADSAVQDHYPEVFAQCYGCGRLNAKGLHIRSIPEGDEWVCRYLPRPEHTALPGIVYGGMVASLIDCHATGTAGGAATRAAGEPVTADTVRRFVTARLEVDYLAPTPHGVELELRARATEIKGRKVVVDVELRAQGQLTARGHAVCVEAPAALFEGR